MVVSLGVCKFHATVCLIFQMTGESSHHLVVESFQIWSGGHKFGILNKNVMMNKAQESDRRMDNREKEVIDRAPDVHKFVTQMQRQHGEDIKPIIVFFTVMPFRPDVTPLTRDPITHENVLVIFTKTKSMVLFEPFKEEGSYVLKEPYTEMNRLALLLGFDNGSEVPVLRGDQPWMGPGSMDCYFNSWRFVWQLHESGLPDTSSCRKVRIVLPPKSYARHNKLV